MPVNLPGTFDLGPFSLLGRDETREQNLGDGRIRREFVLRVAAYEPGEVQLPPIDVTYLGPAGEVKTARTGAVAIKIASLIANEPEPALKDAATPVSVMEENRIRSMSAGRCWRRALGALITFFIVRKLRSRRGERPGPPPRPAHEIALERLDRLGALGFLENADNRPFYFAVSEVIRDYLGGRYGFDSLEMTTDELIVELQASRRPRSGELHARRDPGLAVGLRPGEVREGVADRDRGAWRARERDPLVTATRPAPVAPVAAAGGGAGGAPCVRSQEPAALSLARGGRRARIPYWLIAAVFAPLAGAYAGLLRNVEGFRFAHPWVLALIPPAVALVLWLGLGRGAGRRGAFSHSRAGGARRAAARAGRARCASCRRCCGSAPWCW